MAPCTLPWRLASVPSSEYIHNPGVSMLPFVTPPHVQTDSICDQLPKGGFLTSSRDLPPELHTRPLAPWKSDSTSSHHLYRVQMALGGTLLTPSPSNSP